MFDRSLRRLVKKMKIDKLIELIHEMPSYRQLKNTLSKSSLSAIVIEGARPYLLACLYNDLKRPFLVITAQPQKSRWLAEQISTWLGSANVFQMPEPDNLPYTRINADVTTEVERLRVLSQLARSMLVASPPLVIASVPALLKKLPSARLFRNEWLNLKIGMETDPLKLLASLNRLGYHFENVVEVPGSISHRGGIVDIFPITSEMPVRLEFFGNTVESLRIFEPVSQCSLKLADTISIGPASEMAQLFIGENLHKVLEQLDLSGLNDESRQEFEHDIDVFTNGRYPSASSFYASLFNTDTLLSYLPPDCLVVLDEPRLIKEESTFMTDELRYVFEQRLTSQELPKNFPAPFFKWNELETGLSQTQRLEFLDGQVNEDSEGLRFDFMHATSYAGQLPVWIDKIKQLIKQNKRVIAVSHQSGRLAELLGKEGLIANAISDIDSVPKVASLTLVQGILTQGWEMGKDVFLFTDAELFGFLKQQRLTRRRVVPHRKLIVDIRPGDYVVHIEHGIGKFSGVITMKVGGMTREYMLLEYSAGDRLYVPTDQIDRVGRYIGASDHPPSLSRLGSMEWVKSKEKARKSAEDIAQELLTIYAAR